MTIVKKIFAVFLATPSWIVPGFIARRADPERFSIDRFVTTIVVPRLTPSMLLLDAGSGKQRWRTALAAAARYEATDFENMFDEKGKGKQDFICNLEAIPQPAGRYDAILNTQVLEHIEHPQKAIDECFRILKPGGSLYLTTNQMFPVHAAPYNFFFFTRYGLESLFTQAGFVDIDIRPRGGFFWVMAKMCQLLPSYLFYQAAYTGHKASVRSTVRPRSRVLVLVLSPFFVIAEIVIGRLLPFLLFYADVLDRHKDFTLGYTCVCKKMNVPL
jgi:SAM-dependent methyltransferase